MDDSTNFWDWLGQNPEAIHQFIYLFGPRGIPASWAQMQGYSGHSFKFVNSEGAWKFCQIHVLSNQGTKNLSSDEAAGMSPDVHQKDLFERIENGQFPSWSVKYQLASMEELQAAQVDPFDLTKTWDRKKFPLHELGQLELNKNVANYFAEIEQVAFLPSALVPGFEPSADPVLQSRLFSYPDTHRHRLGPNYLQLPVNAPSNVAYPMYNFQRNGFGAMLNQGARPNHLSSLSPPQFKPRPYDIGKINGHTDGHAIAHLSGLKATDFDQPRALYGRVFTEVERKTFIKEVSGHMQTCTSKDVLANAIAVFHQVDADLAAQIAKNVGVTKYVKDIKQMRFMGSHNHEAGLTAQQMIAELHPQSMQSSGQANGGMNGHAQGEQQNGHHDAGSQQPSAVSNLVDKVKQVFAN
jgi:catalase